MITDMEEIEHTKGNDDITVNVVMGGKQPEIKQDKVLWMRPAALDFFKWVVTTVIIGGFAILYGHIKDESELKLKQMDVDSKLIAAVSGKFDPKELDINKMHQEEINYLKFISTFVTSDKLISRVQIRLTYLSAVILHTKIIQADSAKGVSSKDISKFHPLLLVDLAKINQSVPENQLPMRVFIQENAKALAGHSADSIILAEQPDKTIYSAIKETSINATPSKIEDNYNLSGDPQTFWCKKGYYVVFNNILRVGVDNIDPDGQVVKVNYKDNSNGNPIPLTQVNADRLIPGSPVTLDYQDVRYQVTLSYIGGAGLNPFTKAAYITVAVYKKN